MTNEVATEHMTEEPEVAGEAKEKATINRMIIAAVAIAMAIWQLLYASGLVYVESIIHRAIFLCFALVLTFLIYPSSKKNKSFIIIDIALIAASASCLIYFIFNYHAMLTRAGMPALIDTLMGLIALAVVLEAARRTAGIALSIIAGFFIFHAYFSNFFPGILHGRGFTLGAISEHLYTWAEGIFGLPLEVASTYIFMFVIFGAFFAASGVGNAFMDLAFALFGKARGGPAKVAIFASGLMGMVSGSAAANVVTTGALTIPMMKRIGYRSKFAGAVETVASTGGMIMPPLMAAAAFLIAEYLAVPYANVMLMALIPAFLYYFGLFWGIDAEACREGLRGLNQDELPNAKEVLKKSWYLFLPIILLIYILVGPMWSPNTAALYSIGAVLLVSAIRKDTRMSFNKIMAALEEASKQILVVAAACAAAGIIVGSLSLTGLGMNLSGGLVALSGGNLAVLIVLIAVVAIILGMGLTPTAVYITLVVMLAPTLELMGISKPVSHFFVFYFGCLSVITPPVAVAAFAAAGIAKDNPMAIAVQSVKLALPIYIIPFTFVLKPTLLAIGGVGEILVSLVFAMLAVYAIATAGVGHHIAKMYWWQRIAMLAAGVMMLFPELLSSIIGLTIFALMMALQFKHRKDLKLAAEAIA